MEEEKKNKNKFIWILLIVVGVFSLFSLGVLIANVIIEEQGDNCKNSTIYQNGNTTETLQSNEHRAPDPKDYIGNSYDSLGIAVKPIIYLYPQEETELTVKLGNKEKIICSYPKYKDGWKVIANPDGTLIDTQTNRQLYALYWEGKDTEPKEITDGFVVKGSDIIKFLEEKLEILGLNYKEAEEFIVYWLPKLEQNEYNYIRFATIEEINEYMPLEFSKEPDTLIRVLMEYKGLDEYIEVPEQKLETPTREGFVAVEWGGTEINRDIVK